MHCFAILYSILTHVVYCHDRLVSICWISFIPMSFFHSKSGLVVQPNDRDAVFGRAEQDQDDNDDDEATTQQQRRRITMYRDGFVVDDGSFRRLNDPANAEFLRALAQGTTPRELEGERHVGLIDRRNDDYVEVILPFAGTGTTLGGRQLQSIDGIIDPTTFPSEETITITEEMNNTTNTITRMTTIAVRLMNGQRRIVTLPVTSTIWDLAIQLKDTTLPLTQQQPFTLVAGFPPTPLTDLTKTIQDAGLLGAQVIQTAVPK